MKRFLWLVWFLLPLLVFVAAAQDMPRFPQPDQLSQDEIEIAFLNKYIVKLQKTIIDQKAEIDRLVADNKALREK